MQKNSLVYFSNKEKSMFLKNYIFLGNFNKHNNSKNIFSNNLENLIQGKIFVQNLSVFYRTSRLLKYKRRFKKIFLKNRLKKFSQKNAQKVKKQKKFNYKKIKNTLFCKIFVLNNLLRGKVLKDNYTKYKQWSYSLFPRSINLFIDFLKILDLIGNKKIQILVLGYILGLVFRTLHKRKHAKFLRFAQELLEHLITFKKIKGAKLLICGRLKGKPRSNKKQIEKGSLNLNSAVGSLEYTQQHVYTLYGAFGFKFWINYY
jgi:hypothetical protein